MSENKEVTRKEFVEAIRNNSVDGKWVSGKKLAEILSISVSTVPRYVHIWNKQHPEDPITALRGSGYRMVKTGVADPVATRYPENKTEEGYSDPTAAAAMATEDNPIKSHTLWLTRESNGKFAYFAVLRATKIGAVGYRFDTVEDHPYMNELVMPSYISKDDGMSDKNDLVCDLVRPTFKLRKYMVEKVRDLERTEVRNMAKAVADLIGTDYFLRQQLEEKRREVFMLNRRIESLKQASTKEANTEIVKPVVYPATTAPISDKDLAILKAQNEIYKTFFDRMTSGDNLNATIRVTKEN